jgi:periplasmic protein TonB
MFDKLVESTKVKQGGRARRLFLATMAVYAVALTALGVATVIGFHPALAEGYDVLSKLTPPPIPSAPDPNPVQMRPNLKSAPDRGFVAPVHIQPLPPEDELSKLLGERKPIRLSVAGVSIDSVIGRGDGMPGGANIGEAAPPPPPTPTPVVKPAATPTPDTVVRLTSKLTQGRVIRRVQPPYPAIARQARIQGSVQVQINISETGVVTNVTLLSGHPLLRDAALQAAKQWLFIPTELNGLPVRAIGLLTFNFTLN